MTDLGSLVKLLQGCHQEVSRAWLPYGGLTREESTSKFIEAVGKSHLLVFIELMAACFFKTNRRTELMSLQSYVYIINHKAISHHCCHIMYHHHGSDLPLSLPYNIAQLWKWHPITRAMLFWFEGSCMSCPHSHKSINTEGLKSLLGVGSPWDSSTLVPNIPPTCIMHSPWPFLKVSSH